MTLFGLLGLFLVVSTPFALVIWLITLQDRARGGSQADPADVDQWLAAKRKVSGPFRRVGLAPRRTSEVVQLPLTVKQLAQALADGEECAFALHDALQEAGHPALARPFREPGNPAAGWAIDIILGKR